MELVLLLLFVAVLIGFFVAVIKTVYIALDPSLNASTRIGRIAGVWGIWLACVGLLMCLLPCISSAGPAARRAQCSNNLRQIAIAMDIYHDKHGSYPPAYSVDKNGRPLHSWRVLLLPFMEEGELYKKVRLDEPWDSPHNRQVIDPTAPNSPGRRPSVFYCLANEYNYNVYETSYLMIVGPKCLSDGPTARAAKSPETFANTICVVEVVGSGIRWQEPRDLDASQLSFRVNDPEQLSISSRHRGGAQVAFCDGRVLFLPDSADPSSIRQAATIDATKETRDSLQPPPSR